MEAININELDSETTILYKYAVSNRMANKLIHLIRPPPKENQSYIDFLREIIPEPVHNIIDRIIRERITQNSNLEDLIKVIIDIADELPSLNPKDVFMIYFALTESQLQPSNIQPSLENIDAKRNTLVYVSNEIFKLFEDTPVEDYRGLSIRYQSWNDIMNRISREDTLILEKIEETQTELLQINPVISPITFTRVTKRATLVIPSDGMKPVPSDGIDVFNQSVVSYNSPYIQYNASDDKYYKLYKGEDSDSMPNYNYIVPSTSLVSDQNSINMTIWSGSGQVSKTTQKSYVKSIYRLERSEITYNSDITPEQDETVVSERIEKSLGLNMTTQYDIKTSGYFRIYGAEFDEISLTHYILTDYLMSSYLFINESTVSYPFKKRLKYHYRAVIESIIDTEKKDSGSDRLVIPSSVTFSLVQGRTSTDEIDTVINPQNPAITSEGKIPAEYPYIDVLIDRATSRSIVRYFSNILPRLLLSYMSTRQHILDTYVMIEPNIHSVIKSEPEKEKPTKIKTLSGAAKRPSTGINPGDLVPTSNWSGVDKLSLIHERTNGSGLDAGEFTKAVQASHQPFILHNSEVALWEATTYTDNRNNLKKREVMRFPHLKNPQTTDDPWLFVCPTDENPVPDVKPNNYEVEVKIGGVVKPYREWFPFLPYCYPPEHTRSSLAKRYLDGEDVSSLKEKHISASSGKKPSSYRIKTGRVLIPGRLGNITSPNIMELLKQIHPNYEYARMGVVSSPNSFIHSVLKAILTDRNSTQQINPLIDIDAYISGGDVVKEIIVKGLRGNFISSGKIHPSLLRQEMFESSEQEIISRIGDVDSFFDPSKYYRILEELYNINIYVFTPSIGRKEGGRLEIPKFREFHARPHKPHRKTIIIYKHEGSESQTIKYPQCEVIMAEVPSSDGRTKDIYQFDETMNSLLYDLVINTASSITWNISPVANEPVARNNLYSISNYLMIFTGLGLPDRQIIDTYGKLRGFVYFTNDEAITVMFIPSRPENIPSIDKDDNTLKLRPTIDTILSIFQGNTATGYTTELLDAGKSQAVNSSGSNELINGIWLKIYDINYGIYCPFQPITKAELLSKVGNVSSGTSILGGESRSFLERPGPPNPISTGPNNIISRTRQLRRTLDVIMQMILWAYIIWKQQYPGNDVNIFVRDYFVNSSGVTSQNDSANEYNMDKLSRKFPLVGDIDSVIKYIQFTIPSLVKNGKFSLYSDKFYKGLSYFIRQYEHVTKGLVQIPPTEITGLYQTENDFFQFDNTAIFLKEIDMKSWLETIARSKRSHILIRTSLDIGFGEATEPYIYMSPNEDGNIYLIQNVVSGDKNRALNASYQWYLNRINPGYMTSPYEMDFETNRLPAHFIYYISNDNQPFAKTDFTSGDTKFLQILAYTDNNFAAMLPIL
jgi:hypothetical protein